MKTLRVMDSPGDTRIEFDETQADATATREAKAMFDRLTAKGAAVFAVNQAEGLPDRRVTDFNDLADENVIVPRTQVELAHIWGTPQGHISNIITKRVWKND